mgnify:CR=1 FL=1
MNYCIVNDDNIIENIIVADDEFALSIGAKPSYDDATIGKAYNPPAPDPTWNEDVDAMLVDHELRLSMVELGLDPKDESEVKK